MNLRAMALSGLLLVAPGGVRAEPAPREEPTRMPLFPTLASYHEQTLREAQQALERQLSSLPGVVRAHVQIERAHPADVPLDQPLPAPTLRVILVTRGSGPSDDALEGILQRAREDAPGSALELLRVPDTEPITPSVCAPSDTSRDVLKHVLAVSLIANVLLATLLLARRKLRLL